MDGYFWTRCLVQLSLAMAITALVMSAANQRTAQAPKIVTPGIQIRLRRKFLDLIKPALISLVHLSINESSELNYSFPHFGLELASIKGITKLPRIDLQILERARKPGLQIEMKQAEYYIEATAYNANSDYDEADILRINNVIHNMSAMLGLQDDDTGDGLRLYLANCHTDIHVKKFQLFPVGNTNASFFSVESGNFTEPQPNVTKLNIKSMAREFEERFCTYLRSQLALLNEVFLSDNELIFSDSVSLTYQLVAPIKATKAAIQLPVELNWKFYTDSENDSVITADGNCHGVERPLSLNCSKMPRKLFYVEISDCAVKALFQNLVKCLYGTKPIPITTRFGIHAEVQLTSAEITLEESSIGIEFPELTVNWRMNNDTRRAVHTPPFLLLLSDLRLCANSSSLDFDISAHTPYDDYDDFNQALAAQVKHDIQHTLKLSFFQPATNLELSMQKHGILIGGDHEMAKMAKIYEFYFQQQQHADMDDEQNAPV